MAPHVQVEGKLLYHWDVNNALNILYESPSAKRLVDEFQAPKDNQGNVLTIVQPHQAQQCSTTSAQFNNSQAEQHGELFGQDRKNKLQELVNKQSGGQSGEGTSSMIHWNSNQSLKLNEEGKPTEVVNDPAKSHLVLAHELVHAHGHVTGTSLSGDGIGFIPSTKAGEEELRATGISMENFLGQRRPEYDAPISENTIREELNEPKRTQYHFEKQ